MGTFDADAIILDEDLANELLDDGQGEGNNEPSNESQSEEEKVDVTPKKDADQILNSEELFKTENNGEKVGDNKGKDTQGEPDSQKSGSANTFSLIAASMRDEGILPEEINVADINDADTFKEALEKAVLAKQDEVTKRVTEALKYNVEPSVIQSYENELSIIDKSYTDEALSLETKEAEQLRRGIMLADYQAQGFSKEKAQRFVEQSFKMGSDIEDAKESAASYKKFVQDKYKAVVEDERKAANEKIEAKRKLMEEQKSLIMSKDKVFDDFSIPDSTRNKVYENMTKNVAVDSKGNPCTAIEKYAEEHPQEAARYAAMFYTLTNGYTDFSGLSKSITKKERRNAFSELEEKLQGTSRLKDGSLDFSSGVDEDSSFSGDWQPFLGDIK